MSETNKNTKNNDTNKTRVYDVDDLIFGDEKSYESERKETFLHSKRNVFLFFKKYLDFL